MAGRGRPQQVGSRAGPDRPLCLVLEPVVVPAQRRQVGRLGGSLRPSDHMVEVAAAGGLAAAREAAGPVPGADQVGERRRRGVGPGGRRPSPLRVTGSVVTFRQVPVRASRRAIDAGTGPYPASSPGSRPDPERWRRARSRARSRRPPAHRRRRHGPGRRWAQPDRSTSPAQRAPPHRPPRAWLSRPRRDRPAPPGPADTRGRSERWTLWLEARTAATRASARRASMPRGSPAGAQRASRSTRE